MYDVSPDRAAEHASLETSSINASSRQRPRSSSALGILFIGLSNRKWAARMQTFSESLGKVFMQRGSLDSHGMTHG